MRMLRRSPALLVLVSLVLAVTGSGCGSSAKPTAGSVVKVIAAENFWGDIAGQIGGDHVAVRSIISDPSADPHQYESDARDAAAVADARLVIVNGVGYDDSVSKLLSNSSSAGRVVVSIEDVLHVTGNDANPHLWYDLPRVPDAAKAIEQALAAADPGDAASFAANLEKFDASLAPLNRIVNEIKTRYHGAPVAYTERVAGYLLADAGLTIASPSGFSQAIEDGNEPSAGDTKTMDDLISRHRIRALLYNAQATSPVTQRVQDLAHGAGIPIVPVTETLPKNEPSYQAWQQHQLQALLTALGG
jgi:zinc/manganese transport system substrate-binding protein